MASTTSVSKGCFVFNKDKFVKRRTGKTLVKQEPLFDDPWYLAYKKSWNWVEEKFETLCHNTFSSILNDLVTFVDDSYRKETVERDISAMPTAALLTGINMPDHGALFSTLRESLHEKVNCCVATLHASKCKTVRHAVEQMTSQFMNIPSDEDSDSEERCVKVKRSQCNMLVLQSWYHMKFSPISKKYNLKRKEIDSEDSDTDKSRANMKRQKLDIHTVEDEIIKISPRNHLKNPRKTTENGGKSNEVSPRTPKKQAVHGKVVSISQETPTKQNNIGDMNKKDFPIPQRTPRKINEKKIASNVPNTVSIGIKSSETIQQISRTSKTTPNKMKAQKNKCSNIGNSQMVFFSNSVIKKYKVDKSEITPTKNQKVNNVEVLRNGEIKSPRFIVDYDISSEDSDSSVDSLIKKRRGKAMERNIQIKEESKELNSPMRRSQRSRSTFVLDNTSYKEDSDSSLNSPKKEDSDSSMYEDSESDSSVDLLNKKKGKKEREINVNEKLNTPLRKSQRSPKTIIKDGIFYSGESDISENLCDRKTKKITEKDLAMERTVQIKEESKKQELNSPMRRSQRSRSTFVLDNTSYIEDSDSSLNSPKKEDSDSSMYEDSENSDSESDSSVDLLNKKKGKKEREINVNERLNTPLRSQRPPKTIIKDGIFYSGESDISVNSCDRKTKVIVEKKDSTRSSQTTSEEMTSHNDNKERPSVRFRRVIDEVYKNNGYFTHENWNCQRKLEDARKRVACVVLKKVDSSEKSQKRKNMTPKAMSTPEKSQKIPVKNNHISTVVESKENLCHAVIRSPLRKPKPLYENNSHGFQHRKKLIVIIPEFEKFSSKVLQDLIMILRSNIPSLPIVLIMGIATSVAVVHQSLPYRMSACLSIKAFQSPPSVQLLNSVLEKILFSSEFPFRLGGKTFRFLMDVFLFYDLSVKGFVQAMKFCMMEHFCGQDWKVLCCNPETLNEKRKLTAEDIDAIRNLPTFMMYINQLEKIEEKEKLMSDNEYTKKIIVKLLKNLHNTLQTFHVALKCLHVLVADLPKKPLGTHLRELYGIAVSSRITRTSEYEECFQLLKFLSRDELLMKVDKIVACLQENNKLPALNALSGDMRGYRKKIQEAGVTPVSPQCSPTKNILEGKMSRSDFKVKLRLLSKKNLNHSPFEKIREEFLNYLSKEITYMLHPPAAEPLAEVFMFDNWASVKTHVVGAPRAALHTALNDPQFYLECECCKQNEKDSILSTMPDLCVAYKLYKECGRLINLYDWLQSFSAVVDPHEDDEEREINPQVQARFTRAVAELQFMGFLKTSSRKIDHVTKLCFDGGF